MDSDSYSNHSSDSGGEEEWLLQLQKIKANDPHTTKLRLVSENDYGIIQNMTDEGWEELGRDISNNTHLSAVDLGGNINDHKMLCLFQGLTRSSSLNDMELYENELSVAGVRSLVPFLQNANNLSYLDLDDNNIQSTGFNELFRALSDSPIETLRVNRCNIEAIEIESDHIPQNLKTMLLDGNSINSDGCREIAKLLKGGNTTLQTLSLDDNKIDDDGVGILVDALKNNTSLTNIYLRRNNGMSFEGIVSFLRLINDISSITATLQSNHTLQGIFVVDMDVEASSFNDRFIQTILDDAVRINKKVQNNPDRVGKEKIIQTQLYSGKRKVLEVWQGVSSSLYSEIDPLQLPEVLALVGRRHGQRELYVALKASIAGVISTVNRRECIHQQRAYHATKLKELDAELAAMDEADRKAVGIERDGSRSSKRRRV